MELTVFSPETGDLFAKIDIAPGNQKGVVILIHGLGEHLGRYDYWTGKFLEIGYNVFRVDLPGHGKSPGKRGHIKTYSSLREVIGSMVKTAQSEFPGLPVVLYGHSLGGTICLDYLISGAGGINVAVITSPWLKLSFEPSKSKMALAAMVKRILPGLQQSTGLIAEHISRERSEVNKYVKDPLVHGKISVSLFTETYDAASRILKGDSLVTVPLLLIHGTDDKITSFEGSKELAEKAEAATLRLWEDGYHELHNENFKEEMFAEIEAWLNNKLGK